MKQTKKKRLPLLRLSPGWGPVLCLPISLAAALVSLYIQPGVLTDLLTYFSGQPFLAFLNYLPFLLLTLAFSMLLNNPFWGGALAGGLGGVLSLVNRTMIEKRDEPLSPKDIALIKEAGNAAQSYDLNISQGVIGLLAGFVVLLIILGVLFRQKPLFAAKWKNACVRIIGFLLFFGVLSGCVQTVYSDKDLYNSFPVNNRYYITGVYNQLGFPYCFCYNFNTYLIEKPEGFTKEAAEEYIAGTQVSSGSPKDINVIMVMNEAFSDVTNNPMFDYPQGEEPLKNYNALTEDPHALTGYIVVPNYGAGTANTEFDVLTGMQTNMISESGASAFRVLNHDVDSVFREFLKDGYFTQFIHPGQDWFYNRQNVYKYFGAEELIFSERFEEAERMGSWVTDSAVLEVMEEEFTEAVSKDEPYFNYTVTIQNHMSYTAQKYGDTPIPGVKLKEQLSPTAQTMLSVYTQGVTDADEMLGELVEFYSGQEEPVMLVFFGDHLPQLGDGYLCYNELGIALGETGNDPQTTLHTYETPYIIWVNDSGAELLDFAAAKESLALPQGNTINANYLGAMVLELTGRGESDPFFAYLNSLRRELPILRNGTGLTGAGEYFSQPPEDFAEDIQKLRFWEYYKLQYWEDYKNLLS